MRMTPPLLDALLAIKALLTMLNEELAMNMTPPVLAALLLVKKLLVTLINEDLLIDINVSMSKAHNMTLPLTAALLTKRLVVVSNED